MNALQIQSIHNTLASGGYSEKEIEEYIVDAEKRETKIYKDICPECDAPGLQRKEDPRLDGPCLIEGPWFNFKCHACGYFFDAKLPVPTVSS